MGMLLRRYHKKKQTVKEVEADVKEEKRSSETGRKEGHAVKKEQKASTKKKTVKKKTTKKSGE